MGKDWLAVASRCRRFALLSPLIPCNLFPFAWCLLNRWRFTFDGTVVLSIRVEENKPTGSIQDGEERGRSGWKKGIDYPLTPIPVLPGVWTRSWGTIKRFHTRSCCYWSFTSEKRGRRTRLSSNIQPEASFVSRFFTAYRTSRREKKEKREKNLSSLPEQNIKQTDMGG